MYPGQRGECEHSTELLRGQVSSLSVCWLSTGRTGEKGTEGRDTHWPPRRHYKATQGLPYPEVREPWKGLSLP